MQNIEEGREETLRTYRLDTRSVSTRVFCYSQKRVMRSTVGFSEAVPPVEPEGVVLGGGGKGEPVAAIMLDISCCCIMNIIIDVAIGLNRTGLVGGKCGSDGGPVGAMLL